MRSRAVSPNAQAQGPKKINIPRTIDAIRDYLRDENVSGLESLLTPLSTEALRVIKRDENFRRHVDGILKTKSKKELGVDLALTLYRRGLITDIDSTNPITTNTVICTAQELDTWKAVELSTHALLLGVKVDPKIILCTLVDADEDLTTVEKMKSFIRLAKLAASSIDIHDRSVVRTYNVILAKLGDPTSERDREERDLSFIAERTRFGIELADRLLNKGISFNAEDAETRLRFNHFIRGVRTVAENIIQLTMSEEPLVDDLIRAVFDMSEEDKIREDASNFMKDSFRLLSESIGKYEIKGETVNSSFSSLFTNRIPLNDELLKSVNEVFQKSIDLKQIRIHMSSTTLNVLVRYILDSKCEGRFNVCAKMIEKANSFGYKFHDQIISEVNRGCTVSPVAVNKPLKTRVVKPAAEEEREINGVVPIHIMRKYFPGYKPETDSSSNPRLRGGLGVLPTSYLN